MFSELKKFVEKYAPNCIGIVCHQNADPDAVCSAYSLSSLLRESGFKGDIVCLAESVSKLSKRVLETLNFSIADKADKLDLLFLVDTNNLVQLGALKDYVESVVGKIKIGVIDHHAPTSKIREVAELLLIDESCSSTSEIIYWLFCDADIKISEKDALAIMIGITYDSRHFIRSTERTFLAASKLLSLGADYSKVIDLLRVPMDRSEKIARLKAAKRAELIDFENYIIAVSEVSAFEASACRALIDLGADIAVVLAQRGEEIRISVRSTQEVFEKKKLHLGKSVMEPLGKLFKGEGGGHPTAAGFNGVGEGKKALKEILRLIKENLSKC
ncbi:MAG: DHH family phosphoesterase [Candidatus Odinarchaeia archaeon]